MISHVALSIRKAGTRLRDGGSRSLGVGCPNNPPTASIVRGSPMSSRTLNVVKARHALLNPSDTNCRRFVATYRVLCPCPQASFMTTVIASRHRLFPGERSITEAARQTGVVMELYLRRWAFRKLGVANHTNPETNAACSSHERLKSTINLSKIPTVVIKTGYTQYFGRSLRTTRGER